MSFLVKDKLMLYSTESGGKIESFNTRCNDNCQKLNISRTNELVVDYRSAEYHFVHGEADL